MSWKKHPWQQYPWQKHPWQTWEGQEHPWQKYPWQKHPWQTWEGQEHPWQTHPGQKEPVRTGGSQSVSSIYSVGHSVCMNDEGVWINGKRVNIDQERDDEEKAKMQSELEYLKGQLRERVKEQPKQQPIPKEEREEKVCSICMEQAPNVAFLECGHVCCCVVCADGVNQCPMCRADITKRVKLFLV
jgi:C3HC4-type zinc finger (RING finger) protein